MFQCEFFKIKSSVEKIPEDILKYGVTNISTVISGCTLNAPRKRENMGKILNIQTCGRYYPRQGKNKLRICFLFPVQSLH